jgi:glucose/arabinose dehydrogenase
VALDPGFASSRLIYWSYAEPRGGSGANNTAVARGTFVDGAAPRVDNVEVIYHQTPPDGALYLLTDSSSDRLLKLVPKR